MSGKSRRAASLVAVAVAALVLIGYAAGIGPFGGSAEIKAKDVCHMLGGRSLAAGALNTVLPEKGAYTFQGDDPERTDVESNDFSSHCVVGAGGETLASATSELATTKSYKHWLNGQLSASQADGGKPGSDIAFEAGYKAVATPRRGAILVPCLPEGSVLGAPWSLSVEVRLDKGTDSAVDEADARQALAELALGAARHAHGQANCELPSKLPEQAPDLNAES